MFEIPGQVGTAGTHTSISALLQDPAYAPDGVIGSDLSYLAIATLPPDVAHVDRLRVDEQIARIDAPYGGQRAAFLGFVMPHTPRAVHQQWLDLYDPADIRTRSTAAEVVADISDVPATELEYLARPYINGVSRGEVMYTSLTEEQRKTHVRYVLATLSHTSHQIGRLLDHLHDANRPFVVVLTADHGYHMGEKGHWEKGTLYDKALLTPLGIYSSEADATYPVGNTDWPVSLLGLAKTVTQLAGIDPAELPEAWGGVRFDDPAGTCTEHLWGRNPAGQSRALVFRGGPRTYELIVHPGDAVEMYNLTDDPGEIDNLTVPDPPADRAVADEPTRVAWNAEAHAELDLRGRRQRASDWRARRRAETRAR